MDGTQRYNKIVERIHPKIYTINATPDDVLDCLFIKKRFLGRQAFAMMQIGDHGLLDSIHLARIKVKEITRAVWGLREVGLYLVLCGKEALWRDSHHRVKPDRTGLHSVIVQGIQFLDLESGAHLTKQSKWGPLTFGDLSCPIAVGHLNEVEAEASGGNGEQSL